MAGQIPELSKEQRSDAMEALGRVVLRAGLRVLLFVVLAIVLLGVAYLALTMMREQEGLRTKGLVAIIVAGVGSTLCLSGAMYALDVPMTGRKPTWYVRWVLKFGKRVFAVAQIGTIGLALYAGAALVFDLKILGV